MPILSADAASVGTAQVLAKLALHAAVSAAAVAESGKSHKTHEFLCACFLH